MNDHIRDALDIINKNLDGKEILWGVGGSILLNHLGLVEEVHDIDLMVSEKDIDCVIGLFDTFAVKITPPIKGEYVTRHFHTYTIGDIDIDIMSGFRIKHDAGIYEFPLDESSVEWKAGICPRAIPLTCVEDWLVPYSLMINREVKVKAIYEYLLSKGVSKPYLLHRALEQALPDDIRRKVESLL